MTVTIQDVKNTALSAPTVAMVITAFRLFERIRTRKFGMDDAFALLSALMLLVFVVGMFIHLGDPTHLSRITKLGLYYALSELFYGVIWCARLSILFSIVRITPSLRLRRVLYCLAGAFGVCWAILFAQDFWTCENEPGWKDTPSPQCALGTKVAIAQLITDVFADSCLIAVPTRLLWNLKVSKAHRLRLLLIFSTSIITSVVSLIHAYYVLRVGGLEELIAAIVENAVSLIVCNSAVIVTTIMRFTGSGGEDDSPSRRETYAVSGSSLFSKKSTTSTMVNSIQLTNVRPVAKKADYDEEIEHGHGGPPKVPPKWDWPVGSGEEDVPQEHLVRFNPGQDQGHYQKPEVV